MYIQQTFLGKNVIRGISFSRICCCGSLLEKRIKIMKLKANIDVIVTWNEIKEAFNCLKNKNRVLSEIEISEFFFKEYLRNIFNFAYLLWQINAFILCNRNKPEIFFIFKFTFSNILNYLRFPWKTMDL